MMLAMTVALPAVCIWAFVKRYWRGGASVEERTRALLAVLVSNATAGIWALFVAPLLPSYPSAMFDVKQGGSAGALAGMTLLLSAYSLGPNLVGMALISSVLRRRGRWLRICRWGGFVPAGMVYGMAVLAVSALPLLLVASLVGRLEGLVALFGSNLLYGTAMLSGMTAVGVYALVGRPQPPRSVGT